MLTELITKIQDYIMEHLAADNWQMVIDEFAGLDLDEIIQPLNKMYPQEDNRELAEMIFGELK